MKLQNLNELRYIVELFQNSDKQDPWYFVGEWPDPRIRQLIEDGNTSINVYDRIYYSPIITNAKIYNSATDAEKAGTRLYDSADIEWSCKVKAVSAKIFFKANLKGPVNEKRK